VSPLHFHSHEKFLEPDLAKGYSRVYGNVCGIKGCVKELMHASKLKYTINK
jgi:hypothetical protein